MKIKLSKLYYMVKINKSKVLKNYDMMLTHLTSHIKDPKESIDPKDYKQAKILIDQIKKVKGGNISLNLNYEPDSDTDDDEPEGKEGKGIYEKTKKTLKTMVYGVSDFSAKIRNVLNKQGNKVITGITIGRTPVSKILESTLSNLSTQFKQNLEKSPYDKLFHLFILVKLFDGTIVRMEKNEIINIELNSTLKPNTETEPVNNIPQNITIMDILNNARKLMGDDKFFRYSARDSNCQDWILGLFNGSKIGDEKDRKFIKQDTKQLFENTGILRKISNTVTDIGARANTLIQGAGIESDYIVQSVIFHKDKWDIKTAKKWLKDNNYKSPKVDEEENTLRFRQINPDTIEKKGYKIYRNKKLGKSGIILVIAYNKISRNNIMPRKSKKEVEEMEGQGVLDVMKNPLRKIKNTAEDLKHVVGGEIHHHHHYHIYPVEGGKINVLGDLKRAFDPKKNGVAKAFQPVENVFTKDVPSALIHKGIPTVTGAIGSTLGSTLGPMSGIAAGYAGEKLGEMAAKELGKKTGYGLKKGSQAAKDHMAKIRAMKKK